MFFKNKIALAPMSGKIIPVDKIEDDVFSQKILGDGLGILPCSNEVFSPVNGTIIQVIDTKHAVAIEGDDGIEILLHLGIDTVSLKGEGFEVFVKEGDSVKAGQKIMTMDCDFVASKGLNTTCCIIITNHTSLKKYSISSGDVAACKDTIIEFKG